MALPDTSRLPNMLGAALAARFRKIGLTRKYVREMALPADDLRSPLAPTRPALLLDDPAPVALRLFFCRTPVSKDLAAAALGQDLIEAVRDCGVVIDAEQDRLVSPFHLRIVEDLYLFSDYLEENQKP